MGDTGRVPALDGLRGVAIGLVLLGHAGGAQATPIPGWLGVNLFFALSGYLITGRLLSGQPLRDFYRNRALRLLPAMLVMVGITGALFVAIGWPWWWPVEAASYVRNITAGHFGATVVNPYNHMWSLALEEQFYLVWPLALGWFVARRRSPVPALAAVAGVSLAVLAWAVVTGRGDIARWSPMATVWPLAVGSAAAYAGAAARWPEWLSVAWLRWFGVRSYGIYLWHVPLIFVARWFPVGEWSGVLGCAAGVGVAVLSWRWIEVPFLRLKSAQPQPVERTLRSA